MAWFSKKPKPHEFAQPDAAEAVDAARDGRCIDAMHHLYEATPHRQSQQACSSRSIEAQDYREAMKVVTALCVRDSKPSTATDMGFFGVRRGRTRRRR